ncbi:MAG: DNRLRE domain-containing protein, partial [Candidatus Sumerlaeia bacterium]|nr:DNRLRE domain-containing protein [Candidatus Sumerlaeia bacterium]
RTVPIGGPGMIALERATAFRQGMYPDPSYSGGEDTHVVMYRSRTSSGLGMNPGWHTMLEEGRGNTIEDDKIPLIKFNVASIPPSATVFGAKLLLYQNPCRSVTFGGTSPTLGVTHRLYASKVNRSWSEGRGSGAADGTYANLGEASWFWAKAAQSPWGSGGLRGGAADCDMPESSVIVSSSTINTWVKWDVTRMVANWVASPSSNNGVKISQDDRNTTGYPTTYGVVPGIVQFTSRNNSTVAQRPLLVVLAYQPDILSAQHWELYR